MIFSEDPAPTIEKELLEMRKKIGSVNKTRWRDIVGANDSTFILKKKFECVNRAFFKGVELLELLEDIPQNILCLCEAPGGFYEACKKLYPDSKIFAHSLMQEDSIKFSDVVNIEDRLSVSFDGDITNENVLDEIPGMINNVSVVFADGGMQAKNLDTEEHELLRLLSAQLYVAIRSVNLGGTIIVKMFEGNIQPTRQILELVRICFQNLDIVKPISSKLANSERYIIGYGRKNEIGESLSKLREIVTSVKDVTYLQDLGTNPLVSSIEDKLKKMAMEQTAGINHLLNFCASDSDLNVLRTENRKNIQEISSILTKFGIQEKRRR